MGGVMYSLTASLPKHYYGNVHRSFITNHTVMAGWERCIIHAVSCRPAQVLTFSILLENGAQYRGVPIHALVLGQDPQQHFPEVLTPEQHQVWGCFGTEFSIIPMTLLQHLPAQWRGPAGEVYTGRGLGYAIEFHDDGYSAAPQQDKSFNLLVSDRGQLAAMPNNRIRWYENSFTDWSLPIHLRVNHKTYFAERLGDNPETTAWVQE